MNAPRPAAPTNRAAWMLAALGVVLWFATLGWRDLIHPDEGRYAELARAMVASGDWITPRLNGILYFEKPALQYWMTAIGYALLGINEFAARIWPAASGAFAVLALWWVARPRLGERRAAMAAWMLGASAWWIGNGHFLNLDMGLAAFMTLVLLGFWVAQRDGATMREQRAGMLAAWAAMACAVLSKGLIGAVLPGAVLVAYSVVARDLAVWRRMQWVAGLAVFFAIATPWFVAVSMRNPDFAHFFFVHEHFERFLTTQHRRTGAWWYFFPVLVLGALPWTTLLPGALIRGWRREPGRFQPNRLFVAWAVLIFAFFSVSGSKLPSYILPVFPALALLAAQHADALPGRRLAWHAGAVAALAVAVIALLLAAPQLMSRGSAADLSLEMTYRNWIVAGLAVMAAGAIAAAALARRGNAGTGSGAGSGAAIAALALSSLIGVQVVMLGHQTFATLKSAKVMVGTLGGQIPADAPVYSVGTYDQSLPFYLGRPVTLVGWVDEFATGMRIEPALQAPPIEAFPALWQAHPDAFAVMALSSLERFERAGLPMRVVYRDTQRVVVRHP